VDLCSACRDHTSKALITYGIDTNKKTHNWRDVLETVINRRKLTDAQANPSTQRKRYLSPIWQITLYVIRQEQLYALLKNKRKETYIKSNTPHE